LIRDGRTGEKQEGSTLAETHGICILAETNENNRPSSLTLELLGLGKKLASTRGEKLTAVLLGSEIATAAQELSYCGADEVLFADDTRLSRYNPDVFVSGLVKIFESLSPKVVLAGHTAIGLDLLPRLAFSTGSGLVTDCVGIEVEGGDVLFTRPIYGGNALATQRVHSDSAMATVRARVGDAPQPSEAACPVKSLELEVHVSSGLEIKNVERTAGRECPLEEAGIVVSGGRGMGSEEGFSLLRELADLLGGAVGASRPPVDSGWAPTTCQVGITGKVVAPDIYFAVAISGSTQHLSGMGESGKIVAINKDPEAYIFKVSDYGVVGDWKQVLPSLTAKLRELVSE
jgi:electron transfer flavoprotein alpha subunit